jgi:hypothetical protein
MDYKSKLNLNFEDFDGLVGEEKHPIDEKFKVVHKEHNGNDMGKGIENFKIVVKRIEDGKFFEFEYSTAEQFNLDEGGLNYFPKTGYEVFPYVITTTIYK